MINTSKEVRAIRKILSESLYLLMFEYLSRFFLIRVKLNRVEDVIKISFI